MKILVTSGGTKIPIDLVRDITNMSKGTFGTKIATELLWQGHEVYFLRAKGSKSPMSINIDMLQMAQPEKYLAEVKQFYNQYWTSYQEMEYKTFDEYRERLERLVKLESPDVVVLAAAASDYGVSNPVHGKIRSNDMLQIKLEQLPKLIHLVKTWVPDVKLVGFKLLVGSKDYQLIEAAKRSITENQCDMIVANDLADITSGKHKVHLVFPDEEPITYKTENSSDPNYLAKKVASHIIKL